MYIYNVYMRYAYILYIYYISMLYITRPAKCRGAPWPVDCCEERISVVSNLRFLAMFSGRGEAPWGSVACSPPRRKHPRMGSTWRRLPLVCGATFRARAVQTSQRHDGPKYIYNIQSIYIIFNIYIKCIYMISI